MTETESAILLASAIGTGAAALAGALKLLARAITRSIDRLGGKLDANTEALDRNTEAQAGKSPKGLMRGAVHGGAGLVIALLALLLAGCPSVDPLTVRSLERNREVWQEDRRADLDPELVKSRESEFAAQLRYEKSK